MVVAHQPTPNPKDVLTIIEAKRMMHHEALSMSVKKPLYQIGDLIATYYDIEGDWKCEIAYITGLECRPPHTYVEDWWYYIRPIAGAEKWQHGEVPESEILGRVIHGAQKQERTVHFEV